MESGVPKNAFENIAFSRLVTECYLNVCLITAGSKVKQVPSASKVNELIQIYFLGHKERL